MKAQWIVTLVLSVAVFALITGCNKPNDSYTPEQRSAAADQRLSAFMVVCKELGIEAEVIGSIGPGYYGYFMGALIDPGVHAQFIIRGDPQKYAMAQRAWGVIAAGGTAEEAIDAAKSAMATQPTEISHEE